MVCPNCNSRKIFNLRIDSDWFYGGGDYTPVNDKEDYTEEEWNFDASERPDIDLYHCRKCGLLWE